MAFELADIQLPVDAVVGAQCVVGAALDDRSVRENQHLVSAANRTEPMRDHKAAAAVHEARECTLDARLGACIDAAGSFIQAQSRGIGAQRAREAAKNPPSGTTIMLEPNRALSTKSHDGLLRRSTPSNVCAA